MPTMDVPETSETLLSRIKDPADAAAWTEFLAIYQPVVYRMARRRMQDADALDVSQKVFAAVAQAIARWEPGVGRPPFRAWLTVIARHAILNALSRQRPDRGAGTSSILEFLHQQPVDDPQTTAELLLESRRQTLRWATEQIRSEFSRESWAMFWETAVAGRSVADVAGAMQRSVGAVYMARFKVMQRLRERCREATQE